MDRVPGFNTLETVEGCTFARAATSFMLVLRCVAMSGTNACDVQHELNFHQDEQKNQYTIEGSFTDPM